MNYSLSRLSILDVKWADLFDTSTNMTFFDEHHNPYYELLLVAEGVVNLKAGDTQTALQTGNSLLLRPWESHAGWNQNLNQGKFFWVQFSCDPGLNEFILNRAPELNIIHAQRTELRTIEISHEDLLVVPRLFLNRQRYKLLGLFEELAETMKRPQGYFRFHATSLLVQILDLIANDFWEHSQLSTSFPVSYFTFRKLVNHLNNFYETDISKVTLERLLDRKYEYICQVFKKYTNSTINHYIQQLRVQRAQYLLHNTDKSIYDISTEVGYQDSFYFSRIFKKNAGVAPQYYRDTKPVKR